MRVAPNDCVEAFKRHTEGLFGWENESLFWLSPTADEQHAEHYDEESLQRLGLVELEVPLRDFSPRSGPRCDGLGRTKSGKVILVGAKAYPEEAGETSLSRIRTALEHACLCSNQHALTESRIALCSLR